MAARAAYLLVVACSGEAAPAIVPCTGKPSSDEVCIPGGSFTMGHDPVAVTCTPPAPDNPTNNNCGPVPPAVDFAPAHSVTLSPFFLDRLPASNAQYLACVQAGTCPTDTSDTAFEDPQLADLPMAAARPEGAAAYCRVRGKRLATEAEWERAARGFQSFDYTWGNSPPDCSRYACPAKDPPLPPAPLSAATGDVSPEGVGRMLTAAQEWVSDFYDPTYYLGSPEENPENTVDTGNGRSARGNVTRGLAYGYAWLNGTSYPSPAWVRRWAGGPGGIRCARDD